NPEAFSVGAHRFGFHQMVAQFTRARIKHVLLNVWQHCVHHPPKLFSTRCEGERAIVAHHVHAIAIAHVAAASQGAHTGNFHAFHVTDCQHRQTTPTKKSFKKHAESCSLQRDTIKN